MSKSQKRSDDVPSVPNGCWVDLYSRPYFAGRMKRTYGPGRIRIGQIGSLIVGPEALLVRAGQNGDVSFRPLGPRQIVPDFDISPWKGELKLLEIVHSDKGAIDHL
ncbi:MAG TPA: hypothetical protein VHX86_04515 [Tepidisphaeraceae bacterium]|jgi:hypothetical protein|nr:hypothetical protein [Tepidisphaeraceae bacterium]